jgi:hypothetical protein
MIRRSTCRCGHALWDDDTKAQPAPGAILICVYCTGLLEMQTDLSAKPITIEDVEPKHRNDIRAKQVMARAFGPEFMEEYARRNKSS